MKKENILLLTDIPPCTNYTAGIVLNDLVKFLIEEGHQVFCYCVKDVSINPKFDKEIENKIKIKYIKKPSENWGRKPVIGKLSSIIFNNLTCLFNISKIYNDCIKYIKENKINKIWTVVQGKVMITLSNKVVARTKIPYFVQVWDPPQWWFRENNFDNFTKNRAMKNFGYLINKSEACITSSYEMEKYYSNLYNCKCVTVLPALDDEKLKISKIQKKDNNFVIAFSGQAYAHDELKKFLKALDLMKWKYQNKNIIFRYFGYENIKYKTLIPCNIDFRGWASQEVLLNELSKVDILYCPYFFTEELSYKLVSMLSFPGKLVTYLSTKVPVLIHAPNYSSIYKFCSKYNSAYLLDTVNENEIVNFIKKIIDDNETNKQNLIKNANNAFLNNMTLKIMKRNFLKALELKQK